MRINFLGTFRILRDNGNVLCVSLPTHKAETLLALLYCRRHDMPVVRAEIARTLWQSTDEEILRNRLKQTLSIARKALGPDSDRILPREKERNLLHPGDGIAVDVLEFESALNAAERAQTADAAAAHRQTAIRLYAGSFLPGADESWAASERERLAYRYREALIALLHWHEARGDGPEALDLAQSILALNETDEKAAADLMRLQTAMGHRTAALRTFRAYETRLRAEWDAVPSPFLRDLVRRIQFHPVTVSLSLPQLPSPPYVPPPSLDLEAQDAHRLLFEMRKQGLIAGTDVHAIGLPRASLLDALGQVAKFLTDAERKNLRRGHAVAWAQEVRAATKFWNGSQETASLNHLDRHAADTAAALAFLEEDRPSDALAFAVDLHWHWYVRGRYQEGSDVLDRLLRATGSSADEHTRAQAFLASGLMANCMGDNDTAFSRYASAGSLFHRLGDEDGMAFAQMREGNALMECGVLPRARELTSRVAAHFRRRNHDKSLMHALFYMEQALSFEGEAPLGSKQEVRALHQDFLHLADSIGSDHYLARGLAKKANILLVQQEDVKAAEPLLRKVLTLVERQTNLINALCLTQLGASYHALRGRNDLALTCIGMAQQLRRLHSQPLSALERANPTLMFHPRALSLATRRQRGLAYRDGIERAHSYAEVAAFLRASLDG